MPSIFDFLPLILKQNLGKQQLERTPEPSSITANLDNVIQYDRVMETKLSISYVIAIDMIYRVRLKPLGGKALDICSGPGHMSLFMAKHLQLEKMTGMDLSKPMVDVANANAKEKAMPQVSFEVGDATNLKQFKESELDLTTINDAAHHMPNLDILAKVLKEMDRVTHPEGLIVLMDLVRLRTKDITEKYIQLLAEDYEKKGLKNFMEDFKNSMYAAWTPDELITVVPDDSKRQWSIFVPRGLPFAQFLIGYPKGQKQALIRKDHVWTKDTLPITAENLQDYEIAKMTLFVGSSKLIK